MYTQAGFKSRCSQEEVTRLTVKIGHEIQDAVEHDGVADLVWQVRQHRSV